MQGGGFHSAGGSGRQAPAIITDLAETLFLDLTTVETRKLGALVFEKDVAGLSRFAG